jgi:uncharacterized protein YegP (UPF0339 family)
MAVKFEIFIDRKKQYRFNLKAGNGEIVAVASESYDTRAGCLKSIKSIQKNAPIAEIVDREKAVKKAVKAAPVKRGSKTAKPAAEAGVKKPRGRRPKAAPEA